MLSVLSSGTLSLSDELNNLRREANRLRSENTHLLDLFRDRRGRVCEHLDSVARVHQSHEDRLRLKTAFTGFLDCRKHTQIWSRGESKIPASRGSAWLWLWRRKVFSLWHRAVHVSRREYDRQKHREEIGEHRNEIARFKGQLEEAGAQKRNLDILLVCEQKRVHELEVALAQSQTQVSDLKATLKDSYVRQFEEAQRRQTLEQHFSKLVSEMQVLRSERKSLGQDISQKRDELANWEALHAERELRLIEASGELTLAEEVIDDITSGKCVGLRRFFSKYNMPGVLISLFRKIVELQAQLRAKGRQLSANLSHTSLGSDGSSPHSPQSPRAVPSVEAEVRNHVSLHKDGTVSRMALQAYIEGLHLHQISAAMVTQVVLALLDLDLGSAAPCDVSQFASALLAPPPWEQLDFATALWGSVGEPSAVVQQHRRSSSRTLSNGGTGPHMKSVGAGTAAYPAVAAAVDGASPRSTPRAKGAQPRGLF